MNQKDEFYDDMKKCEIPFTHIEKGITDPTLKPIDELYGAADVLSIENAGKHQRNLWLLSFFGTLVALFFLLYDEAELHWLIFGCIIIILIIFYINKLAERTECHRKYLQYRLLAESLRVQYFLSKAGIDKNVGDIMPWFVKKDVPWIREVLKTIPPVNTNEKRHIINCWIRDQMKYHQKALKRTTIQKQRDRRISRRVLYITLATYIIALLFEIYVFANPGEINYDLLAPILKTLNDWGVMLSYSQTEMIRAILKIILGTMSAATLFTGSYYGKMSLSLTIEDHRRMAMLYEKAENKIVQNGGEESEDLILSLAHEFLIENSTWYAYQKKNQPSLTFE
jgi:hypothetical protein